MGVRAVPSDSQMNVNVSVNVNVKYKCKHERYTRVNASMVCSMLSVHTNDSWMHLRNVGPAEKRHLAPFSKSLHQR